MTQVSIEVIKQQYPNPETSETEESNYCVAGAVAGYYGLQNQIDSFIADGVLLPDRDDVEFILQQINPNLAPLSARNYADSIIKCNDNAKFEEAWSLVHEALTYNQSNP